MNMVGLKKLSYGMFVVSSKLKEKINGQIANTVIQVSAKPPKVVVAINKGNLTHEYISESKVFSVSILSTETPVKIIGLFGFRTGREVNKFEKVKYRKGITGCPILLQYTVAYLEVKVLEEIDVGTHTLFVGEVIDSGILGEDFPRTYEYYQKELKGKAPERVPTYMEEKIKEKENGKI